MAAAGLLNVSSEVAGALCELFDFQSILNLLLTGSRHLEGLILRSCRSLILRNGAERISPPFPQIAYRFSALSSLSVLSNMQSQLSYIRGIRFDLLGRNLRSLKLYNSRALDFVLLHGSKCQPRTKEAFLELFPKLESLKLHHPADPQEVWPKFPWTRSPNFRPLFEGLPRLHTLAIRGVEVPTNFLQFLPPELTYLNLCLAEEARARTSAVASTDLASDLAPKATPTYHFPPHLTDLRLQNGWTRITPSLLDALPASLTTLLLLPFVCDESFIAEPIKFWRALPKSLTRLELQRNLPIDSLSAQSMGPQQLRHLNLGACKFSWDAVASLPRSLTSIEHVGGASSSGSHRNVENWPPSLTRAQIFLNSIPSSRWKDLPRTLRSPAIFIDDTDAPFIADLPSTLEVIRLTDFDFPSGSASVPFLQSLTSLHYEGSQPIGRSFCEALANCHSLTELSITGYLPDVTQIALLNCKLESLNVNVSDMEDDEEDQTSALSQWCYAPFSLPWAQNLKKLGITSWTSSFDPVRPRKSDTGTSSVPLPSMTQWIASLPRSITYLDLRSTLLPIDSITLLPTALETLDFSLNDVDFSFPLLHSLPTSIKMVFMKIHNCPATFSLHPSAEEIRNLPPNLTHLSCFAWYNEIIMSLSKECEAALPTLISDCKLFSMLGHNTLPTKFFRVQVDNLRRIALQDLKNED